MARARMAWVAAVLAATVPASVTSGADVASPQRLDRPGRTTTPATQSQPQLASTAGGPVAVFVDYRDRGPAWRAAHLAPDGWKDEALPDAHGNVVLTDDGAGTAWALWVEHDEESELYTASTRGDGVWTEGPEIEIPNDLVLLDASGAGGRVAIAWASEGCGGATVVSILDPVAPSLSEPAEVLGAPMWGSPLGLAMNETGDVWLAAPDRNQRIVVMHGDPSGSWTTEGTLETWASEIGVAVLGTGEVVVATANGAGLAWVRSPLDGRWSDPLRFSDRARRVAVVAAGPRDALDDIAPVALSGSAILAWTEQRETKTQTYTAGTLGVVAGSWSEPQTAVEGNAQGVALAGGPAPWLAAAVHHDVVAAKGEGTAWSSAQPVHSAATVSAEKYVDAVTPRADDFDVVWRDDAGHNAYRYSARRGSISPAGARSREVLPDRFTTQVPSEDGSTLIARGRRLTVVGRSGSTDAAHAPRGYFSAVSFEPGSYLVAGLTRTTPRKVWYRAFSDGVWSGGRLETGGRPGWVTAIGAGAGTGWVAWAEGPALGATRAFPIVGARFTAQGAEAPRVVATARADRIPQIWPAGNGAGDLAVAWKDNRAGRGVMVTIPGREPMVVTRRPIDGYVGTVALLVTPEGDATLLVSDFGRVRGLRLVGGRFRVLPHVRAEQSFRPYYDYGYGPCMFLHSDYFFCYAPPVRATIDGAGRVHLFVLDRGRARHVALAPGALEWSRPQTFDRRVESFAGASALDGDVGVAWTVYESAAARVLGTTIERGPMRARLRLEATPSGVVATLVTPAGFPIAGKRIEFRTATATVLVVTDRAGRARADLTGAVTASFAGDEGFEGARAAR